MQQCMNQPFLRMLCLQPPSCLAKETFSSSTPFPLFPVGLCSMCRPGIPAESSGLLSLRLPQPPATLPSWCVASRLPSECINVRQSRVLAFLEGFPIKQHYRAGRRPRRAILFYVYTQAYSGSFSANKISQIWFLGSDDWQRC